MREANRTETIRAVIRAPRNCVQIQASVPRVAVDDSIVDYMLAIVERTRTHESLALGVSPRGAQALYRAAQALALVEGRDYVIPDDVKRLAVPVFAHRVVINTRMTLAQRARRRGRAHHSKKSSPRWKFPSRNMKTAIIGLPMVGKTCLFTILTGVHEATRVGSMEARIGVTKVPDARLEALAKLFEPPKITHAIGRIPRFSVDLERNPARPRLPGQPARGRRVRACAARLRADVVPHEKGSVDPVRDLEDVETELILSDLVVVEKRLERLDKDRKKIKNPELDHEFDLLERCKTSSKRTGRSATWN